MLTPSLYTLGLDFGTLSVRALIVDTRDGRTVQIFKNGEWVL